MKVVQFSWQSACSACTRSSVRFRHSPQVVLVCARQRYGQHAHIFAILPTLSVGQILHFIWNTAPSCRRQPLYESSMQASYNTYLDHGTLCLCQIQHTRYTHCKQNIQCTHLSYILLNESHSYYNVILMRCYTSHIIHVCTY